jgi:hypothetical protein
VTFDHDHNGDGQLICDVSERWRHGLLARAQIDDDQDEGFHGLRCALARNGTEDCALDGHFIQISEFMDAPEDDISSECEEDCPANTTFRAMARQDHVGTIALDLGDTARLAFWVYQDQLYCEASDGGETISTRATGPSFTNGTIGLSTLNMFGNFDNIKVCEALGVP